MRRCQAASRRWAAGTRNIWGSSVLRHFHLFVAAPGRQAEAEDALREWLDKVRSAPQFRGGSVLREYAGEMGAVQSALAVIYDVGSREEGRAFREATRAIPNPMSQDIAGAEPPDQGAILFGRSAHGPDDHHHDTDDVHSHLPADGVDLDFDRGGGMLARLMHGHFEILASTSAESDRVAAIGAAQ